MSRDWVLDPHSGGVKIPEAVRRRTEQRIQAYANTHYAGEFIRIEVRFRGAFCYIDAYIEPPDPSPKLLEITNETQEQYRDRMIGTPLHFCRLRYFGREEAWSVAFFTYSNERYEPSIFPDGTFFGTPEDAFEIGAMYLQ
jgi:hypothetical protein